MKGTRVALGLMAISLLAACGGGGGGSSSGGSTGQPVSTQVTGTASKGILSNAIVTAYAISNGTKGSQLAQTRTSSNGQYNLTLINHSGPVLVELTVDTNTQMKCDIPAGCGTGIAFGENVNPAGLTLQSVLPQASGSVQAAITPFTHLAAQLAQSRSGGLNATNIGDSLVQVADLFDLPPLTSTQPVDITASSLGSDSAAQRYAVLSAAIAQMAGTPAQLTTVLNGLSAELIDNNGQLAGDSAAETYDMEDVLAAALAVATDPVLSAKLDSLVSVIINESLTTAQSLGDEKTTATGTSSGDTSALDKVKQFVAQAHDLVQSILQADNDNVAAEVTTKMDAITVLQQTDEVNRLSEALSVSHALMTYLAEEVVINDRTDTSIDSTEATTLLTTLGYSDDGRVSISFGNNFSVALDAATNHVAANGDITVSLFDGTWNCDVNGCEMSYTPIGSPVTFTASNLRFSYPSFTTPATQFAFGVAANGSLESAALKLDFTAGSGSGLTATYGTSETLQTHVDALQDLNPDNDAAHQPNRVELKLNQATLTAKLAPATHYSKFVGTINLVLDKVDVPLIDDLSGHLTTPAPSLFSVAGSFSSAAGEKLEASVSLDLDDDLSQQALATPDTGFVRAGIYQLSNVGADTATFQPATGYAFPSMYWGYTINAVRVTLLPDEGTGCRDLETTGLLNGAIVYGPWLKGECYSSSATLTDALASALNPTNPYLSGLAWELSVTKQDDSVYMPSIISLANGPVNGMVIEGGSDFVQNPNHFVRSAFSATLKLKLGGSANLDSEVNVSGHRTSLTGGDFTIKVQNNGKWLMLAGTGTDFSQSPLLTLSNQDGVAVTVKPVNLNDEDDTNDAAELVFGGVAYGKLYELAGAWVARFSDNTFTLL